MKDRGAAAIGSLNNLRCFFGNLSPYSSFIRGLRRRIELAANAEVDRVLELALELYGSDGDCR